MPSVTSFIALIERRPWRQALACGLAALALLAGSMAPQPAHAVGGPGGPGGPGGRGRMSSDLRAAIDAAATPTLSWAKEVKGLRYVKTAAPTR